MADARPDLKEAGAKYDGEKVRFDLVPPDAVEDLAKLYTLGARKYADRNWEKGISYMRIIGALKRHLNKFERGQEFDEENGQREATAIAWNAFALLTYQLRGMDGGEFDDRPRAAFFKEKK